MHQSVNYFLRKIHESAKEQNRCVCERWVRRSKFKMIFNFSLRRRVPGRTWSEATYRYSRSRKIKKHLNLQENEQERTVFVTIGNV